MDRGISSRPLAAQAVTIARLCAIVGIAFGTAVPPASAAENQSFTDSHAAFGKPNSVHYDVGVIQPTLAADPSTGSPAPTASPSVGSPMGDAAGFYSVLSAMLLGKDRSILEAQAAMTNNLEGESDFYWGGFRVWSTKPEWKDGKFQMSVGLPSISMRAPLFAVPVGPITIRVDAGVSAEAAVTGFLQPLISIPIQFTSVRGGLTPEAAASGFVEGYATFIAIRGGVGGSLELVRANATLAGQVSFGAFPASFSIDGFLSTLSGKIYAFVDYFNIFGWSWKRWLQPTIADWKGKCFSFSKNGTGGDPCAVAP